MSIPWPCQLLFSERDGDAVVLDLVALDVCPFSDTSMDVGYPFTIRLCHDQLHQMIIDDWVSQNVVLSIRELAVSDRRWFCVSEGGRFLLMELNDLAR